jgi:hypothetical protein
MSEIRENPLNPGREALPYWIKIVLMNAVPLIGVLFYGWDARLIVIVYILETIVVGLAHVLRMVLVHRLYGKKPTTLARLAEIRAGHGPEGGISGGVLIPFFAVHYFFFIFVQGFVYSGFTHEKTVQILHDFNAAIQGEARWALIAFGIFQILHIGEELATGIHRHTPIDDLFFKPYKRIFVQQLVVIIGAFFISMGFKQLGPVIVLVVVKTGLDLLLAYIGNIRLRSWATGGDAEREKSWDDMGEKLK